MEPDLQTEDDLDGLVPVGRYPTLADAQEHALVVLAKGRDCALFGDAGGAGPSTYTLSTSPDAVAEISAELAAYDAEQDGGAPAPAAELPQFGSGAWWTFSWAVVLAAVFVAQSRFPDMTARGASAPGPLFDGGEWWRPITALFLHADLHHLVGNIGIGSIFCTLVCRSVGPALGWALILLGGVLGNLATAYLRWGDPFSAIGASSAVFAGLGVLSGFGIYLAFRVPGQTPWAQVMLPFGGGLALLGWFGAGGPGTDVLGHVNGFAAGLVLGLVAGALRVPAAVAAEGDP